MGQLVITHMTPFSYFPNIPALTLPEPEIPMSCPILVYLTIYSFSGRSQIPRPAANMHPHTHQQQEARPTTNNNNLHLVVLAFFSFASFTTISTDRFHCKQSNRNLIDSKRSSKFTFLVCLSFHLCGA
jgi:hypothetical protein